MKTLSSILLFLALFAAGATSVAQSKKSLRNQFQSLGDNAEVVERVRRLDTNQRIRVVQKRAVDRNHRVELAMDFGTLSGGDSYVETQTLGGKLQYHINPRWSIGAEYQKAYNSLTPEGTRRYDIAYEAQKRDANSPERFPAVDFALDTKLASISFYPIYGKMNLFDKSIAQFDLYTLLGYGQKTLNSGTTDVWAGGLGAGVWLNSLFTARVEIRYEKYKDLLQTEQRNQDSIAAMASLGILIW